MHKDPRYYLHHADRLKDWPIVGALEHFGDDELHAHEIKGILFELTGEADGANWHWIVELYQGGFAYLEGGCAYSGWDCGGNLYVHKAESLKSVLAQVGEIERTVFEDMLKNGETHRYNRSGW